ncbi:MAG: hypothetical protein IPK78_04215 [Rhodospirillales bacterium]|nr:hypothetical protein [Rhodospirillales bacterium]
MPAILVGMDTRETSGSDNPVAGFWLATQIIWGPLLWPMIIANVIGLAWCVCQGWRSFAVLCALD